jgi:hypothetical protein
MFGRRAALSAAPEWFIGRVLRWLASLAVDANALR